MKVLFQELLEFASIGSIHVANLPVGFVDRIHGHTCSQVSIEQVSRENDWIAIQCWRNYGLHTDNQQPERKEDLENHPNAIVLVRGDH